MTQPITPLRQRMLDDMAIRRLAPGTQAFYVSAVAKFAKHFAKSPDLLGYEDVRAYQITPLRIDERERLLLSGSAVRHNVAASALMALSSRS